MVEPCQSVSAADGSGCEEARRQLMLFRQAIEQLGLPVLITNVQGRIEYANPAMERTSGYGSAELIGATPRLLSSGEMARETYQVLWQTVMGGESWQGELLNRRKNGEKYWERLLVAPLRDEAGAIAHLVSIHEDLTERKATASRLEQLASIDQLTGLPNRACLLDRLAGAIRDASIQGCSLSFAYLDLDRFRAINDTVGSEEANRLLIGVASRMQAVIRRGDILARLGGDEFALLLWNVAIDDPACEALQRLRAALAMPQVVCGRTVAMTASTGVAVFPRDGADADSLLRAAEAAALAAKRDGDDKVRLYSPELQTVHGDALDMTAGLRRAIDCDELVLHFQPQVSLLSGEIVGAEALIRWQHPERGLLAPGVFIAHAEETGLIVPMTEWVIYAACAQAAAWREAGLPPLKIAINLSARHFREGNLPDVVAATLAATGLEANRLELELTESAMMQDSAAVIRIVDRFKSLGLRLALDDFGTGYSSLAHLSRFAIDYLKVDQSFIRDVTSNPVNASIVTATIAMAHKLGKRVIAEGVETEAQMNFLRRHECDQMQGYFFSKPLPAAEFEALLREGRRLSFEAANLEHGARTLLLVDDEPGILNALKRLLRREGYRILTADSAAEGLDLLAKNQVQVIISDQRMPGMSGVEFLSRVKDLYPETVRMVLSGYSELGTLTDAINRGAIWKFLTKPWDDEALKMTIVDAFRQAGDTPAEP